MNTGNDVIGTLDVLHVRPLSEMGKAEVSRRHRMLKMALLACPDWRGCSVNLATFHPTLTSTASSNSTLTRSSSPLPRITAGSTSFTVLCTYSGFISVGTY